MTLPLTLGLRRSLANCRYCQVVRVAVDEQIFAIQAYGGISRVFAELARQFVEVSTFNVELSALRTPIVNRYVLDSPRLVSALSARTAMNEWTALAAYMARIRTHPSADIVHNTFYLPHGLAPIHGAKRIVTVHDMIPELLPHTRRRLDRLTLKRKYVHQADHIICVSDATRRDLLSVYPEISVPISVVHSAVDQAFQPGAPALTDLPEQYLLFVGHRTQYKDAAALFRAFARIAADFPDVHLVCIGGGAFTKDERLLLARLGVNHRVRQDVLSDPRMPAAYGNALAFVFPSRFEGFGLPVLEAMACGAPTLLAEATALPEVGADAAMYFPIGDDRALSDLLAEVLSNRTLREELRTLGLERASTFSWKRTARETKQVYDQAVQR